MTITNNEIAAIFNQIADLLEIEGANPFRVRAYRNASRTMSSLSLKIADMVQRKMDLTDLPGIGDDLASKIETLVKTGKLPFLNKIQKRVPAVLSELLKVSGLGPKRVKTLYLVLHIRTMNDLKKAIATGELQALPGFGEKTVDNIRTGLLHVEKYAARYPLAKVKPIAASLITYLKSANGVLKVECAGSFRRHKETVGDLDIVVSAKPTNDVISHFTKYKAIATIISKGTTRAAVRLRSGLQVDLRVVPPESFGAALLYFTGSKAHNIALRKIAIKQKRKLNEYGLFKGTKQIAGQTEKEMYHQLGLSYIEPELREDKGEIEAARI